MKKLSKLILMYGGMAFCSFQGMAQRVDWYCSTEGNLWKTSTVKMGKSSGTPDLAVNKSETGEQSVVFKAWGATFNELDWDALGVLTRDEQDEILRRVFSPEGDLGISRGRISIGANDYARSWYSCDEMNGDLELRHFNIERDKQTIIPFIRAAQKYNPGLTFWVSPWCPPSWMKINNDYPVLSSRFNKMSPQLDYLLYGNVGGKTDPDEMKLTGERKGKFPRQLATTDYFIQDPRYLQAYANYFCKFITAYAEQGIPIDMVIYQNEAYSYTPYPGCAWTAEGTIRFNRDYLGPTLKREHPEVKLYLGTFNTNRVDHVQKVASDEKLQEYVSGMAFQWEGREALPVLRKEHPEWNYMCSESECGWGSFDWKAGEHTFELINHYLGNGCNEYTFWNFILKDNGESPWGWKQNALIRVNSQTREFTYTPEYYAVKHYANFIRSGAKMVGYKGAGKEQKPVLVYLTPEHKYIVIAGNFTDQPQELSVSLDGKALTAQLPAHSYNTFQVR